MGVTPFEICKICNSSMDDPRMLTCFHCFCLKCLESSVVAKESSKCPTCQIQFEMPQAGLKDLKKCEFNNLNIIKQESSNCDSCKENQAIQFCVDCSFNYCSTCLEYHKRIPTSCNHQLQSLTSSNGPNINKYSSCPEHSEAMTLFCEDCNVVLCSHDFTLTHITHKIKHISEYFKSVKDNFEQNIEINEKILKIVVSNCKSSGFIIAANEIKATLLKTEIQKRGEDLKKAVDSIVVELITDVDQNLRQHQQDAADIMMELTHMETSSTKQIEISKEQCKNLNFENVAQASLQITELNADIPNYCDDFNFSLFCDLKNQTFNLKKAFGNVEKGKLRLVRETKLRGNFQIFSVYKDHAFFSHLGKSKVHISKCSELTAGTTAFVHLFKKFEIHDMLVIGSILYISGSYQGSYRIVKVPMTTGEPKPTTIYNGYNTARGYSIKLRKSACGNIIAIFDYQLLHMNINGQVTKTIMYEYCNKLTSIIDVLQHRDGRHVIVFEGQICMIDDYGVEVAVYSQCKKNPVIVSPSFMVKDKYDNVYVYDTITKDIFVLDRCLRFKTCYDFGRDVSGMLFDEDGNKLIILSNQRLLTFDVDNVNFISYDNIEFIALRK